MAPTDPTPWMGPRPRTRGCACHVCRPGGGYGAMERHCRDTVLRHGWQVMLVSDDCECGHPDHDEAETHQPSGAPPFAYTIGLGHRIGHPELLMSGLGLRIMQHALNTVAQRVMDGRRLVPGDALEDVLAGVPVAVERVSDTGLEETVIWSGWFHRRKPEALALVWPDGAGVFPWQPGAPPEIVERQPQDWRVPMEHRDGLAVDPPWPFPVPPDSPGFSCTHVVDDGAPVLYAVRQSSDRDGGDWTFHCGEAHAFDEMRVVHLAHLVRSAPGVRTLSDLGIETSAERSDVDSPWVVAPVPPES